MYVMDKLTKWEDYLPLVEFTYNNDYQSSTKMSPFEILYGRKCMTPISWDNPVDRIMVGPDMLQEMESMVKKAQQNLKVVQDRQKSYADQNEYIKNLILEIMFISGLRKERVR
jgi:hypothetical protein